MAGQTSESSGIIYGNQNFLLPSHMNFGRHFLEQILKFGNKVALINGKTGENITYATLAQEIVNTAAALTRMGIKKGDVIAICSENRIECLTTAIATMYSGAVITFINIAYSKAEIVHAINISKPKFMFLSPDAYKTHVQILTDIKIIQKFIIYGEIKSQPFNPRLFKELTKTFTDMNSYKPIDFYGRPETALILYSSGTTGLPKGAKLTHLNLIITSLQPEPSSRDLIMLTVAPWCTCMGLISIFDSTSHGKTVVFLQRFEEKLYLQTVEKYKAELLLVVPPLVIILSKSKILDNYDVSSVELLYCGGAPLDPENIAQVKKRFPNLKSLLQGYGMTEASGALTEELEHLNKQGSVGKITPGNVIKIVDIETRKILGPNQPGEVCLQGPVLFEGYIRHKADLDEEGFYKTGDIAYYDEEGYFYVVDRIKELIKYKAWQVAPSELEAVLLQHPAVKDVGVIGMPDSLAGEVPVAFIVKQAGATITEKELIDYVASKVSPWKQIRGGVRFIEEIPKNGSGKILRKNLRQLLTKTPSSKL